MFENLTAKLQETFRKLSGKGKLSESDVNTALREVKLALLEADVHFKVVKDFLERVQKRAVGAEVIRSLSPAQQVIKIVHQELMGTLGEAKGFRLQGPPPHVVMLVGLQGSGKTTTAAKLALKLRKAGQRPLLVAADVYRPAAVTQLEILGRQLDIPVHANGGSPVDICVAAVERARRSAYSVVLLDTAGRLHIDDEMMEELAQIRDRLRPAEVLLVADAMTGQDAVRVAQEFHRRLGLTGLILTKMDGDARGGAAISIRAVTEVPIYFLGMGEKLEALEAFHPDRLASRILGMGDMLTLIERAEAAYSREEAKKMEEKLRKASFTLEDFLEQMRQVKRMGPISELLGMLPGLGALSQALPAEVTEKQMKRIEAIICSMTREERRDPRIINASRKRRISRGSGTTVQEVNQLLEQFRQTQRLFRQLSSGRGPNILSMLR